MNILITGTNRGIGVEFIKQYSKRSDVTKIFACSKNLDYPDINKVFKIKLDVTSEIDLKKIKSTIGSEPIDILINNAGIFNKNDSNFGEIDIDTMRQSFTINAIAPLKLAELLVDNVEKSNKKIIANISSRMGSIGSNDTGSKYGYRASKAALNMITKSLSIDLKEKGIKTILIHPGWVQTNMGGDKAPLSAQESVKAMIPLIESKASTDCPFIDYQGHYMPW